MPELDVKTFRTVCPSDAVPEGFVVPHYLADRKLRIAIARVGGRFFAFDDLCPCAPIPCPLSAGLLIGDTLMCQCHGSTFEIATGAVMTGPAKDALNCYEASEAESGVQIRLTERNYSGTAG